jgi:hypothetical protein
MYVYICIRGEKQASKRKGVIAPGGLKVKGVPVALRH